MATSFTAEITHQGTTHSIPLDAEKTVLESAKAAGLELPSSCNAGVCTTCAALVTEGEVNQEDGMGVSRELQAEGYALLCVAYPKSDLKLETEKEDIVYQQQFGQS